MGELRTRHILVPNDLRVASLYDSQAIGKEDLEELKAYLNALEGGEKDA